MNVFPLDFNENICKGKAVQKMLDCSYMLKQILFFFQCASGFVWDRPNVLGMECPHCKMRTCFLCKKKVSHIRLRIQMQIPELYYFSSQNMRHGYFKEFSH